MYAVVNLPAASERERDRETETETDRQTERHRQTDRQTDRGDLLICEWLIMNKKHVKSLFLGLQMYVEKFFIFYLSLFLTTMAASAIGFCVGASVRVFA